MDEGRKALVAALVAAQNADGGYGARPGLPSATEPSALALLALSFESSGQGSGRVRTWLLTQRTPEGGWPAMAGLREPSWATALAVLALARYPEEAGAVRSGAQWLVGRRGRTLGGEGLLRRLFGAPRVVELDGRLVGWPWLADTFSWVEPTAYSLLALRAVRPHAPAAAARIEEGERLLLDRVCQDGGWNYGNSRVLGEELWSYPDTTALALLALRHRAEGAATEKALDVLQTMLAANESGLATALGTLALAAYGREVAPLRARLLVRFERTGFVGDVRTVAWALLASNAAVVPFGGAADA